MLKAYTIVISLATALFVLGLAAPMPVYAQQVTLSSKSIALTAGDTVHLTATARNLNTSIPWTLQIWEIAPVKRLLTNGAGVTELRFDFSENAAASHTYQAILNQPPMVAVPRFSNEVQVVWADRTPTQLILEVNDRRVAVNYTFVNPDASSGVRRDSTIWKAVGGASPTSPLGTKASPTGSDWTAAVNWTAPLRGREPAQVHAYFNASLPPPWVLYLSLNGSGNTNSLCGPQPLRCDIVIPHPANPTGNWLVGAFLYRGTDYADRVDINIQWAFP
jgi:hypothetical protein